MTTAVRKRDRAAPPVSELFETDETAWLEEMARLLKRRRDPVIDFPNLAGYLRDMAIRDRREVESRFVTLMIHLLKWEHQPERRSTSWTDTILHQRHELQDLLESKTLLAHAEQTLEKSYGRAVRRAANQTKLDSSAFPADCPFTIEGLLQE